MSMTKPDKQALRRAAEKATGGRWYAFANSKTGTCAIHTPGDGRRGDIIHWMGFDAVDMSNAQKARNARFMAKANPDAVLALLDELEAAEKRIAELEVK